MSSLEIPATFSTTTCSGPTYITPIKGPARGPHHPVPKLDPLRRPFYSLPLTTALALPAEAAAPAVAFNAT